MKNQIYAYNIYLIGDMGKMVQICNLLNYVKFVFGLFFGVYLQHKCLIYELPTLKYGR